MGNMIAQGPENFSISQTGAADDDAIKTYAAGDLTDANNSAVTTDDITDITLTDHSFTNPCQQQVPRHQRLVRRLR